MNYTQQLKSLADEHSVEYKKNYGPEKMQALLADAGVEFPAENLAPFSPEVLDEPARYDFQAELSVLQKQANEIVRIKDRDIRDARMRELKKTLGILKNKVKDTDDEHSIKTVLQFARSRGMIDEHSADAYELNAIEAGECDQKCECVAKIDASGFGAEVLKTYPCSSHYDAGRNEEVYTIYLSREVAPEEQIERHLERKLAQGFLPEQKDYLPPKTLISRRQLRQSEFDKYFELK
jgi:hypothetical protein